MNTKKLPDLDYLKECFELDPTSPSYLKWNRNRPRSHFRNLQAFEAWKTTSADRWIINQTSDKKYYYLNVGGANIARRSIKVHRIVYALYHNSIDFQNLLIDHINGNGKDNRPENLRVATYTQNLFNRSKQINNKIGHKNIRYHESCKKFTVQVGFKGKTIYFGSYSTIEEAIQVRDEKIKELAREFYKT